jgi:SpoVK/Ycf46/Vps4 family AAA+-type ATPase
MINSFDYKSFEDFKNLSDNDVIKIKEWIKKYNQVKNLNMLDEKIILITGENNSLKTSLAQYICNYYELSARMLNIQDIKINKDIKEFILQISNNKNILSMIYHKTEYLGIIIDDFDTLLNNNDKSVITDFLTLFNTKRKADFRLLYPIIVVCQDLGDKKINDLKKIACHIHLDKLSENDCRYYFERILERNNIDLSIKQKDMILRNVDRDLRKYNYILDDILLISKGVITDEDIKFVIDTFSNKSGDEKINNNLEMIFSSELTVKENIDMYFCDKFLFSFLIHENYPYNLGNTKVRNNDKIELMSKISRDLAVNDMVQNLIFEKQLWDLNINSALLTNVNTNFRHRKMLKDNRNPAFTFSKRKYTTLLNKVSLYFTNRKVINHILHKYGNNNNDAFYLSEFICDCLKMVDKKNLEEDMMEYIVPIVKKLELKGDDVDMLLRLNKLEDEDIKKVYTTKYKTLLKNALDN